MKLKSTGEIVIDAGVIKHYDDRAYVGVFVSTPRKNQMTQNHLQYVRKDHLIEEDK